MTKSEHRMAVEVCRSRLPRGTGSGSMWTLWAMCPARAGSPGLLALILLGTAALLSHVARGAQQTDSHEFEVMLADGRVVAGIPRELSDSALVLAGTERIEVAMRDVIHMQAAGRRESSPAAGATVVLLVNGDRLLLDRLSLRVSDVELIGSWHHFPAWPPLTVPLETVRGIVLAWPDSRESADHLAAVVHDHTGTSDLLLLANGDRLTGEFRGLDDAAVTLGGAVPTVPRSNMRAIAFNPELFSLPAPRGLHMLISLVDGSRITGSQVQLDREGQLRFRAAFGGDVEIPLARLSTVRVLGGRAEWLGTREPADYQFEPYLSSKWDLRRNRNVTGGPLRLDDQEYPFGLGMHSRSLTTYALDGQYRWFHAIIGVDDTAGERGSVVFAIELDGERIATSPALKSADAARSLEPIDVSGKQRLTLIVDFGPFGDIQDYANWCNAVLVR